MAPHVLYGTLDLLVLHALKRGPLNGCSIADTIHELSDRVLILEDGSLYPALYRLESNGAIYGRRKTTPNNHRGRYYRLTDMGSRILAEQHETWNRLSTAVTLVLTR